ncbi:LOW QUALITY PROTEIN: uncharacterized protein LOC111403527 [Olea europaea subsp. europaea]|uniref:LOW QUALITY PROTEIN: uncharacterized protein LOC111403527 n=1 Tax=Olea europaea subsp. europaea TaxID=158383 RepID=A0A8S0PZN9_OLEEU|nr:LOW QUALITY PROTEIN: uncharacterized protein LOC111403527 [Olea europaea subsp. europaea]
MLSLVKFHTINKIQFIKKSTFAVCGFHHFSSASDWNHESSVFPSSLVKRFPRNDVGIFWDLDNKPPKPFPPYDAATRLKKNLDEKVKSDSVCTREEDGELCGKERHAARDILTPKVGYGLMDELKPAGFWVGEVSDKPPAADSALRNHMVDIMDRRMVERIVLVTADSDFVEILKEARLRCLKTVVLGDDNDVALKKDC